MFSFFKSTGVASWLGFGSEAPKVVDSTTPIRLASPGNVPTEEVPVQETSVSLPTTPKCRRQSESPSSWQNVTFIDQLETPRAIRWAPPTIHSFTKTPDYDESPRNIFKFDSPLDFDTFPEAIEQLPVRVREDRERRDSMESVEVEYTFVAPYELYDVDEEEESMVMEESAEKEDEEEENMAMEESAEKPDEEEESVLMEDSAEKRENEETHILDRETPEEQMEIPREQEVQVHSVHNKDQKPRLNESSRTPSERDAPLFAVGPLDGERLQDNNLCCTLPKIDVSQLSFNSDVSKLMKGYAGTRKRISRNTIMRLAAGETAETVLSRVRGNRKSTSTQSVKNKYQKI